MCLLRLITILFVWAASGLAVAADDFRLVSNQRISCGRGLSAGRLATSTCRSYAYLFNEKTSEVFRCTVSLSVTRDNTEILTMQDDGRCVKQPRIFETDGDYDFDVAETEAPSTNAFFGPGGTAMWVSDKTQRRLRGCITIATGLSGSNAAVMKCRDMTFDEAAK